MPTNEKTIISYPNEDAPVFKVDVEKLIKPLFLIYVDFQDEGEIQDTFYQLSNIVEDYVRYATTYLLPHKLVNEMGIAHVVEKMLLVTQLLSACAMISNSLEIIPDKEDK